MTALTEADLEYIERQLGLQLPIDVKEQYRRTNGHSGPTDCQLLFPHNVSLESDLLAMNALKAEDCFPKVFTSFVILGSDGCGNLVCFDWTSKEAVLWNPADGDWIQERRSSVTEIWAHIEQFYARVP